MKPPVNTVKKIAVEGCYVIEGRIVTLTDGAGAPLRRSGSAISARAFVKSPTR